MMRVINETSELGFIFRYVFKSKTTNKELRNDWSRFVVCTIWHGHIYIHIIKMSTQLLLIFNQHCPALEHVHYIDISDGSGLLEEEEWWCLHSLLF